MKHPLPEAALKKHIAVLGMTGGGKTFTTKGIVEHILAEDPKARVCVLDPIKSDWWGITSSASGKRAGLPFHILGGPRGHVPLHESTGKAIGELVGSGALPLSIIDMADFGPGGLQAFFNDFAPALIRKMRGVVYLVLEEAHEFAPKERAGFGGETMTVHFAKKLATAGRSKGIRLIVATQRTQALHNALLGSCQTAIVHQLTYPADIDPAEKWLKGHVDKATFEKITSTIPSLPTGTAWLVSGQAKVAEMVHFPRIHTFDNSATPDGAAEVDVKTAPVDREKLRTIMGDAAKEAEADHLPTLKARIRELEAAAAKKPAPVTVALAPAPKPAEVKAEVIEAAFKRGTRAAEKARSDQAKSLKKAVDAGIGKIGQAIEALALLRTDLRAASEDLGNVPEIVDAPPAVTGITHRQAPYTPQPAASSNNPKRGPGSPQKETSAPGDSNPRVSGAVREGLEPRQQRILDALAFWVSLGIDAPSRPQAAMAARYSHTSTGFKNPLSGLSTLGLVEYRPGGLVALTVEGSAKANHPDTPPTTAELQARVWEILEPRQQRILQPLIEAYPEAMTREESAAAANYSHTSTGYKNPLSGLSTLGLVTYLPGGKVAATPILFVEG